MLYLSKLRRSKSTQLSLESKRRASQRAIACAVEALEQRIVFASLVVNTLGDVVAPDSTLSFREAVELINNNGDANAAFGRGLSGGETAQVNTTDAFGVNDTISFDASIGGGTITLAQGDNTFGQSAFSIDSAMTIDGGSAGITLSGGSTQAFHRLFYNTSNLALSNLTISNFSANGGVGGDGAAGGGGGAGLGGAIYNSGTLDINGVTMLNNSAVGGFGGVGGFPSPSGGGGGGGAFGNGSDPAGAAGGAGSGGTFGGGFDSGGNSGGNGQGGGGGGAASINLAGIGGTGGDGGFAGGGAGAGSSEFGEAGQGGAGGFGGGGGGATGGNSAFVGVGGYGAGDGVAGGQGGGGAGLGGAIFNDNGNVNISNSTFTANSAIGGVGGSNGLGLGGAVFTRNGTVNLNFTTMSANTADDGLGYFLVGDGNGNFPTTDITNSILGQDGTTTRDIDESTTNSGGFAVITGSNNLITQTAPLPGLSYTQDDAHLGVLQNNGGPTQTMRPTSISLALDAFSVGSNTLSGDQRGIPRPIAGGYDLGAVESASAIITVNTTGDSDAPNSVLTLREAFELIDDPGFFSSMTPQEQAQVSGDLGDQYTIQFDIGLAGSRINLLTIGDNTFGPSAFAVSHQVTIVGDSTDGITIGRDTNAAPSGLRLFYVTSAGDLTFKNVTLSDGLARGGDGFSAGGGGAGLGGAILNAGRLSLIQSTLSNNAALGGNGSVDVSFPSAGGGMGGNGFLGGGGGQNGASSGVDAGFGGGGYDMGNPTGGFGGGGALTGSGGFGGGGGGLFGSGGDFGGSGSGGGSGGGGAGLGGAIFNYGGTVVLSNSTLANNTALGGAAGGAGATDGRGYGGGIFSTNGTVTIVSSTVAYNQAEHAGAFFALGETGVDTQAGPALAETTARFNAFNTIFAGSYVGVVTSGVADEDTDTISGGVVFVNGDHNLIQSGNDHFGGSLIADPKFAGNPLTASGRLRDYGGATATVALLPNSPALDAGDSSVLTSIQLATDQRGATRVTDLVLDLGAFEAQGYTLTANPSATPQSAQVTTAFGTALGVTLTEDGFNAPIGGATVAYAKSGGGGSQTATFSTPAKTDLAGQTSATATANSNAGAYTVSATTGTGNFAVGAPFVLTNTQAPAISSANHATFTVGVAGSFTVTTTGLPTAAISKTGALPSGVTFTDNGDGTATIAGTPAAATGGSFPISITGNNGIAPNATQTFTLTVNQAPAITSANHATFAVGSAGSFTVTTTGFPVDALSKTGTLPSGVTFTDNGDGTATIAGTPAAATGGSYPIDITGNNGVGSNATQTFTLTVNQAPAITSANHATFSVGVAGSFTVTTTGVPNGTLSKTGTLPSGVTFTDNGDGTATIAGTPAAATGGTFPISITDNNGVAPNATQTFTLTINQAPAITSADHATFTVGSAGSFTVTTTGFPVAAIGKVGALPSGVTLTDNGNGTATIAGTPAAATGGAYAITLAANNGSPVASQTFTLTVNQAPAITSTNHATFTVGSAGTFTVTTTGFPANGTLIKSGALPTGVTFTDNGNGTATIAGTPAAATGGTFPINVTASNGVTPDATQTFTLTVNQAPAISSANHATFSVSGASSFTVTTTGFPAAALSKTGALPTGITFVDNNNGTATISGTPAIGTGGSYPINITGNNGVGSNATQTFTLTVTNAPAITSANHATFTDGVAGSFTVTTGGVPFATLSKTGSLPTGVTFTDNGDGTATIAGTPAAATGGTYAIDLTANNGIAPNATQTFTLTVNQPLVITSTDHATFNAGSANTFTITTTGFPAPALGNAGSLPAGVTLTDNNDGTATISGTPSAGSGGTYTFDIVANNGGATPDATQSFTLTVNEALSITSADHTTAVVGTPLAFTVTAGGFPASTFGISGTLPTGVSFDTNTGAFSGTPDAATGGTYVVTLTATNGVTTDGTQIFTLTVNQAPAITSVDHVTFTVGTAESFLVQTSGFPISGIAAIGTLPAGVTFVDNGNGTATLSGTAALASGGEYSISIGAGNGVGIDATQAFTLTVDASQPFVTGSSDKNSGVTIHNGDGTTRFTIDDPFPGMKVGRRVALGDVNGDGAPDVIVGAASGKKPRLAVFDGVDGTRLADFLAFSKSFKGGVFVTSGDVNHDGTDDIIVGRGSDGKSKARIRVFSGTDYSLMSDFRPFDATSAARVASADINGDGFADIIAMQGSGGKTSKVKVFDGHDLSFGVITTSSNFAPFGSKYHGGGYVATGDTDADGNPDIIVSQDKGKHPFINVFNATSSALIMSLQTDATDGVRLSAHDTNNDHHDDIFAGLTANGASVVKVFSGADGTLLDTFDAGSDGSVFVA